MPMSVAQISSTSLRVLTLDIELKASYDVRVATWLIVAFSAILHWSQEG